MPPQSAQKKQNNFLSLFIGTLGIFGLCLIFFIFCKARTFNLPLWELVTRFKNNLYFPNHNLCGMGQIADENTLILFCQFLLLTILTTVVCHIFFFNAKSSQKLILSSQIVTMVSMIGFVLFATTQQIHRYEYFRNEETCFRAKTLDEKSLLLFGEIYEFSKACQKILPGRHQGELMTDLDLSKDPYMAWSRLLAYHLYPQVSLRLKNQSPKDCLILFYKKDALKYIPEDYKVLIASKDNNFILAIKNPIDQ